MVTGVLGRVPQRPGPLRPCRRAGNEGWAGRSCSPATRSLPRILGWLLGWRRPAGTLPKARPASPLPQVCEGPTAPLRQRGREGGTREWPAHPGSEWALGWPEAPPPGIPSGLTTTCRRGVGAGWPGAALESLEKAPLPSWCGPSPAGKGQAVRELSLAAAGKPACRADPGGVGYTQANR